MASKDLVRSEIPEYPCVAMLGKQNGIRYDEAGNKITGSWDEVIYFRVMVGGDISHIMQMRREKGWAVEAYHNFDKLKPLDATLLKQELDTILKSPEAAFGKR